MKPILQTVDLKKSYKIGKLDVPALRGLSFEVGEGEFVAIMGPSGCGKSTLLRTINRMNDLIPGIRVDGQVLYHGVDVYGRDVDPVEVRHRTLQGVADEVRREEAQPFQFEPKPRRRDVQLLLRRLHEIVHLAGSWIVVQRKQMAVRPYGRRHGRQPVQEFQLELACVQSRFVEGRREAIDEEYRRSRGRRILAGRLRCDLRMRRIHPPRRHDPSQHQSEPHPCPTYRQAPTH